MVYNTENGASLQKLPDKSQISGKKMLEIENKESKTLNHFQKLFEQMSQSPEYNQRAGRARAVEKMFRGNYQELETYQEILVPCLNNSSGKTIFGSNKITEQRETMKIQNEFHLKP